MQRTRYKRSLKTTTCSPKQPTLPHTKRMVKYTCHPACQLFCTIEIVKQKGTSVKIRVAQASCKQNQDHCHNCVTSCASPSVISSIIRCTSTRSKKYWRR